MVSSSTLSRARVLILLAPGFEEGVTIYCVDRLRDAGLPVYLVSLSAGSVNGLHGVSIRPDYSLDQLTLTAPYRLVIVPGGRQCASALVADPRVHQLFAATLEGAGYIAAMLSAEPVLARVNSPPLTELSGFKSQGNSDITEFTNQLIDLVSS